MTKIEHIVFDIGKVLIHYDPHIPYSRLIPDADERQWFFDNVCTQDWNLEQDRGRREPGQDRSAFRIESDLWRAVGDHRAPTRWTLRDHDAPTAAESPMPLASCIHDPLGIRPAFDRREEMSQGATAFSASGHWPKVDEAAALLLL